VERKYKRLIIIIIYQSVKTGLTDRHPDRKNSKVSTSLKCQKTLIDYLLQIVQSERRVKYWFIKKHTSVTVAATNGLDRGGGKIFGITSRNLIDKHVTIT